MRTVYEPANTLEAYMLKDLLAQQGISVHIVGEHAQSGVGELPASGVLRLEAEDDEAAAARAFLIQWDKHHPEPQVSQLGQPSNPPRRWGSASLLAFGALTGAFGMWIALQAPLGRYEIDHNRDGVDDELWTYSVTGKPLEMTIDRNFDGKIDYVQKFSADGLPSEAKADDDFNGVFETHIRFARGQTERTEVDTDADGYPEMHYIFQKGVLQKIKFLNPSNHQPLRTEYYKLGRMRYAEIDNDGNGTLDERVEYSALGEVTQRTKLNSAR